MGNASQINRSRNSVRVERRSDLNESDLGEVYYIKKTAPLKTKSGEVITDSNKQMERWVEHYLELYSTENTITDQALDTIETLPVMTELDSEPTEDDLPDKDGGR